jgi:surfeit locus 1 family protein
MLKRFQKHCAQIKQMLSSNTDELILETILNTPHPSLRADLSHKRRGKSFISFLIFGLFLIVVLVALGTWQLYRKAEKDALLDHLAQSQQDLPQNVDTLSTPKLFQPLFAEGQFIPNKTITLQSKVHEGKSGVYILDVFQTKKGQFLLVQRGWSPKDIRTPPLNYMKIEGIARVPSPPTYFQPINTKGTYFWIDLKALSKDLQLPLLPYYLVSKQSFDPHIAPTSAIPLPRNNHLEYAITWYSLALCLLFMLLWGRKYY